MFKKVILSIFAIAMIALSSCSDSSSSSDSSSLVLNKLTCTVNGTSFSSLSAMGITVETGGVMDHINVSGTSTVAQVSMKVDNPQPGTYNNVYAVYNEFDYTDPTKQKNHYTTDATITITKYENNELEGTFSYTAKTQDNASTVEVKNGKFRVKIQ
jgi:hypothetical protein